MSLSPSLPVSLLVAGHGRWTFWLPWTPCRPGGGNHANFMFCPHSCFLPALLTSLFTFIQPGQGCPWYQVARQKLAELRISSFLPSFPGFEMAGAHLAQSRVAFASAVLSTSLSSLLKPFTPTPSPKVLERTVQG